MAELIICEKPNAALKIATALAKNKLIKKQTDKIPYYELQYKNKKIIVACAVGHLFGLKAQNGKGWTYPVFDVQWMESYKIKKSAAFSKKYVEVLQELVKKADSFTVATDYDVEGELIGLNVIRYICNKKDASRMKFSTLTEEELIESYDKKNKHIDWGQAKAGETRHILDFLWGVNTSRALTLAIKKAGAFKLMSTGRVQGPALKLVVEKEKEIKSFKTEPFWLVELITDKLNSFHKKDKFWNKKEADKVLKNAKENEAIVSKIIKKQSYQEAPNPFDLTSLQLEAYSTLGISPKETLSIAQDLYLDAYISYPRTSSQKLPAKLNYKKILQTLSKQSPYARGCKFLLSKKILRPNEGKKTDPAHPAIYPTGVIPKKLTGRKLQLYDLIVRRFLATFGDKAKKETQTVEIDVNSEVFLSKGSLTLEKGWYELYGKYSKFKDKELPNLKEGDKLKIKEIKLHEKETQPPSRYTPASIIKKMEALSLGTKSTRSTIIDILYQRNYIKDKSIEATDFGIKVIDTLEKYSPEIIDEKLTRHFEQEMEDINEGKRKPEVVLKEAKIVLKDIFKHFKENEEKVGKALLKSHRATQDELNKLGRCPVCKKGELRIKMSKFGRFVACDQYPECKTTFNLPRQGLIKPLGTLCKECDTPEVMVIRAGRRPWKLCLNSKCKLKESWNKD